ncbi:MAG: DUF488 domain-containing protein [Chthonomonadales bacterium]
MVRIKRIYEAPSADDGERYLVERLWPRGIAKDAAQLAGWLKDVAPSPSLRQWYGHDPAKWQEFRRRYLEELTDEQHRPHVEYLRDRMRSGNVTLVFAARDERRNSAAVLRDHLVGHASEAEDDTD